MNIRWNMIYWLTKKEISKNSPAFLGYIITSHLLRTIEKCEKFSPVVRPTSLNTSKIHFSIFSISLMTRFKSIHRCNAFLSESLRATIWGVCATVLSVTIKSYSRLIFLIKNTSIPRECLGEWSNRGSCGSPCLHAWADFPQNFQFGLRRRWMYSPRSKKRKE